MLWGVHLKLVQPYFDGQAMRFGIGFAPPRKYGHMTKLYFCTGEFCTPHHVLPGINPTYGNDSRKLHLCGGWCTSWIGGSGPGRTIISGRVLPPIAAVDPLMHVIYRTLIIYGVLCTEATRNEKQNQRTREWDIEFQFPFQLGDNALGGFVRLNSKMIHETTH